MKEKVARFAILHPGWWLVTWWVVFSWISALPAPFFIVLFVAATAVAVVVRGRLKPGFPEIVHERERRKADQAADAEWEREKRKVLPRGAYQDKEGRWHQKDGKFIPTPVLPPRPAPNYPAPPVPATQAALSAGSAPAARRPAAEIPGLDLAGERHIVVGTDYYQGLRVLTPGPVPAEVRREPNNTHDSNAIAVWTGSPLRKTGHLSAYWAERYAPLMDAAGTTTISLPGELESNGDLFVYMPDLTDETEPEPDDDHADWAPVDSWGRCSHPIRIEGSGLELAAVRRVTKAHASGGQEDSAYGVPGIAVQSGRRVLVLVDGYEIGHLDDDESAPYVEPLANLGRKRQGLVVSCNLWVASFEPKYSNVTVYLPEPGEIEPPVTLPTAPHVVLPAKTKIQVTGEDAHLNELTQILGGESRVPVAATLHETTPASGRGKPYIEVRIADETIGKLTPTMSEHMLPIVRACAEEHLIVVCRAAVEGNHIKADVILDTTKSGDLSQDWILEHVRAPDDYEPPMAPPAPRHAEDW